MRHPENHTAKDLAGRVMHVGSSAVPFYVRHGGSRAIVNGLVAMGADRFVVVVDETLLALHGMTLMGGRRR